MHSSTPSSAPPKSSGPAPPHTGTFAFSLEPKGAFLHHGVRRLHPTMLPATRSAWKKNVPTSELRNCSLSMRLTNPGVPLCSSAFPVSLEGRQVASSSRKWAPFTAFSNSTSVYEPSQGWQVATSQGFLGVRMLQNHFPWSS